MSQTKEFILKTAFSLFLQKNYKAVTLKEIVDKTGLSKGAFYHYYTSKEKLFFEVVDAFFFNAMLVDYNQFRKTSLKDFYIDYADHIQKSFKELKEHFVIGNPEANINFIHILFDAIDIFPGFRDKLLKVMNDELNEWTKMISIARKNNEFTSPMTDEQIARMFVYSNDGISLRLLLEGRLESMHSEMMTLWNNFYEEIKN
jgi:AcrR family transcriptional regulator